MGAKFVIGLYGTDQVSPDLEIPTLDRFLCIPLGSYLMCFRFLQVAWHFWRTGELPHHDPGQVEGVESARRGRRAMNALIIFSLLIALMLTGMPISIALGLTVLTFLFVLTSVPIEAVALKLFTGIESFEIMAIPFFILAGNFLTHGGVARRMINFATSMIGHWHGGLGLAGVMACALVRGGVGLLARDRGRHRLDHPAGDGAAGLPEALRRRRDHDLGRARHPDSALDRDGDLRGRDRRLRRARPGRQARAVRLGRATVHGRRRSRPDARDHARPDHVLSRVEKRLSAHAERASWAERFKAFRESIWGLLLIVLVLGGIYSGIFTPTEAAAMSAVYAFVIAVFVYKDMTLRDVPKVLLGSANMSAMILYIITNAVLFSFLMTSEQIPQAMTSWITTRASAGSDSCWW